MQKKNYQKNSLSRKKKYVIKKFKTIFIFKFHLKYFRENYQKKISQKTNIFKKIEEFLDKKNSNIFYEKNMQ